ncbi:MAG: contractile injection system protein, VgrG/Pvc8 family, partial [Planctomycetota bacterium]|nr:contractile injection system protein, VgrG/Pvc8 family [Planctomycetota bacterium]
MSEYTQSSRHLSLETPLGKDVLLLTSFTGHEELSRLFTYQLELLSEEKSIVPNDIVGKNVTITLELLDASARHFNGFVSQFSYCGTGDRLSRYTAQVVPWFWFLGLTADCRIFQERPVPEGVAQIFGERGCLDY